jgi:hypothetical protein
MPSRKGARHCGKCKAPKNGWQGQAFTSQKFYHLPDRAGHLFTPFLLRAAMIALFSYEGRYKLSARLLLMMHSLAASILIGCSFSQQAARDSDIPLAPSNIPMKQYANDYW